MPKRRLTKNQSQNLLIVLLALLAIFLLLLAIDIPSLRGDTAESAQESASDAGRTEGLRPFFAAVSFSDGGLFGVRYEESDLDAVYDRTGVLLAEAIGSAGAAQLSDETQWREALRGESVFFDFLYPQPLCLLAERFGMENAELSETAATRRLCLAVCNSALCLYYISAEDGSVFCCETALTAQSLRDRTAEFSENGACFAYELGEEGAALDAYSLVLDAEASAAALTAKVPSLSETQESRLRRAFSMDYASRYSEADGSFVFVDSDGNTLRAQADGKLLYRAQETDGDTGGSFRESVCTAYELCQTLLRPESGEAEIVLSSWESNEAQGDYTFFFSYAVASLPVKVGAQAAEIRVQGDCVCYALLYARTYEKTETACVLLPEKHAMALALEAGGGEWLLAYTDETEGQLCAEWVRNDG